MVTDWVQKVYVTATHSIRYVLITSIKYLVFVKNNGIPIILAENSSFYNKGCIQPFEVLKGNQYNGFEVIPTSFGAIKPIVVDSNVEIPINLLSITPFHNIVTKFVPPALGGVITTNV
jgi:hypothetical protein